MPDCKKIDCCDTDVQDVSEVTPVCDTATLNPVINEFGTYELIQPACTFSREQSSSVAITDLAVPFSVKNAFAEAFDNPYTYYAGGKWELVVVVAPADGPMGCSAENSIGGGTIDPSGNLLITHIDTVDFPEDSAFTLNNDFSITAVLGTCESETTDVTAYLIFRCADTYEATRSAYVECPEGEVGSFGYDVSVFESSWNQDEANAQALATAEANADEEFNATDCGPELWALWTVNSTGLRLYDQRTDTIINAAGIGPGIIIASTAVDLNQDIYFASSAGDLSKCSATTEVVTPLGSGLGNVTGLAFGNDELLYSYDRTTNTMHQLDKSDGSIIASKVIPIVGTFPGGPTNMRCDQNGDFWMIFRGDPGIQSELMAINWVSGAVSKIVVLPQTNTSWSFVIGPNNKIGLARLGGGIFGGPYLGIVNMDTATIEDSNSFGGISDFFSGPVVGANSDVYASGIATFGGTLARFESGGVYAPYPTTTQPTQNGIISSMDVGKMYRIDTSGQLAKIDISLPDPSLDFEGVAVGGSSQSYLESDAIYRRFTLQIAY
jgi:hypothetical protein